MPDGHVAYWYGYVDTAEFGNLEDNANWMYSGYIKAYSSIQKNKVVLTANAYTTVCVVNFTKNVDFSKYSTAHIMRSPCDWCFIYGYNEKTVNNTTHTAESGETSVFNGYAVTYPGILPNHDDIYNALPVINTKSQILTVGTAGISPSDLYALWFT